MRLTDGENQAVVRRLLPDCLGSFGVYRLCWTRAALVGGEAILLPSRIRIAKPNNGPLSGTIEFWDRWSDDRGAAELDKAAESR